MGSDVKNLSNKKTSIYLCLWNQVGAFLLLVASTILIFKYAPSFSLLLLTALAGYTANLFWKKKGFYFSLISLALISTYTIQSQTDLFFSSLLSLSIALSWLLIFLGRRELEAFFMSQEESLQIFKDNQHFLEKQLIEVKASLSEKNKESLLERERLNDLYAQVMVHFNQTKSSLEISEKEREKLHQRYETLSQEVLVYQKKEMDFLQALEKTQSELLKMNNQPLVTQENSSIPNSIVFEEEKELRNLQYQYALLRDQFDEKSQALDLARQNFFQVENELLTLQKIHQEKMLEICDEDTLLRQDLKKLEQECVDLDTQVRTLEELISFLLAPKKRAARSRKSVEKQEGLPFLIQEKIDQRILLDSV